MPLTKEEILTMARRTVKVDVPDFGEVCIRKLSLAEIDKLQKLSKEYGDKRKDEGAFMKFALVYAMSDEDGNRLFVGTPDPKAKPPVSQDEADYHEANKLCESLMFETVVALVEEFHKANGRKKNPDGTDTTVEQNAKN